MRIPLRLPAATVSAGLFVALLAPAACGPSTAARSEAGVSDATAPGATPTPTSAAASPDTLRVLAYNIHHGAGNDEVLDLERIARLIRDLEPDLVALQEVDLGVDRTGGVDQAAVLGDLAGMTPVFGEFMPYQGGDYGMAVLSSWPVVRSWNHRLPDGAEPRTAVTVHLRSPDTGREILLSDIHLYRTEGERLAQALTLDSLLRMESGAGAESGAGDMSRTSGGAVAGTPGMTDLPTILAGDFNSEPGTAVMDTLAAAGWWILPKEGSPLTFRSDDPVREIDYVLLRPRDRWTVLEHRVIEEPVASDHSPIFAVLVLQ